MSAFGWGIHKLSGKDVSITVGPPVISSNGSVFVFRSSVFFIFIAPKWRLNILRSAPIHQKDNFQI